MTDDALLVDISDASILIPRHLRVEVPRFRVRPGTICVVIGPNGSGKSTFGRYLCNISSGELATSVNDKRPHPSAVMVWQSLNLFPVNVRRNISIVKQHGYEMLLKYFNLWMLREKHVDFLSGGERQKLAIARAMITGAELVVMDEPTSSLDNRSVDDLVELIGAYTGIESDRTCEIVASMKAKNQPECVRRSVVVITHDLKFVRLLSRFGNLRVFSLCERRRQSINEAHFRLNGDQNGEGWDIVEVHTKPEDLFTADFFGITNIVGFMSAVDKPRSPEDFCSRYAHEALGWVVIDDKAIRIVDGDAAARTNAWRAKVVGIEYCGMQRRSRLAVTGRHGVYEVTIPTESKLPTTEHGVHVVFDMGGVYCMSLVND